ncbi:MAG: thioredoxin [Pyrinomonadaceae bacterium]
MILKCDSCGKRNRVRKNGGSIPKCGSCGESLRFADTPFEITDMNFESMIGKTDFPVVLDLWAAWCAPCRMFAPTVAGLAKELAGRAMVAKLDTESNQRTAARFRIQSIPTVLIFNKGEVVDRMVGVQTRDSVMRALAPYL